LQAPPVYGGPQTVAQALPGEEQDAGHVLA
jgi:hypothetical protein